MQQQTKKEISFANDKVLLSTTDLDSRITYANDNFCKVAGYDLQEMLGKPHNMVRHSDMPKQAFADLWKTIKQGHSWMGPVKNRCKNGDYYWVNAFVTPIRDENGNIVEYQSVRTSLNRKVLKRVETEYENIRTNKATPSLKPSVDFTLIVLLSLTLLSLVALANFSFQTSGLNAICFLLSFCLTGAFYQWRKQYLRIVTQAKEVFDNPLMSYLYHGNRDLLRNVNLALERQNAKVRAVVGRVNDVSLQVNENAKQNTDSGHEVSALLGRQGGEITQMAAAMEQFSTTIQELSENVNDAAQASEQTEKQTVLGKDAVDNAKSAMQKLAGQLDVANIEVTKLVEGNASIQGILGEINAIAEQTNLLALNAAIEAARAGEQVSR